MGQVIVSLPEGLALPVSTSATLLPRIEDDDDGLACRTEGVADAENHVALGLCQVELAFDSAIHAFTGLTADGDDGGISFLYLMLHAALGDVDLVELGLASV